MSLTKPETAVVDIALRTPPCEPNQIVATFRDVIISNGTVLGSNPTPGHPLILNGEEADVELEAAGLPPLSKLAYALSRALLNIRIRQQAQTVAAPVARGATDTPARGLPEIIAERRTNKTNKPKNERTDSQPRD